MNKEYYHLHIYKSLNFWIYRKVSFIKMLKGRGPRVDLYGNSAIIPPDSLKESSIFTAQKVKFSMKDYLSKCDQIRSFLRIWSHVLKKSLMENFIFCAVTATWLLNLSAELILPKQVSFATIQNFNGYSLQVPVIFRKC